MRQVDWELERLDCVLQYMSHVPRLSKQLGFLAPFHHVAEPPAYALEERHRKRFLLQSRHATCTLLPV